MTNYECHNRGSIESMMRNEIDQVIEDLGISEDMARAVLIKNQWTASKAIQAFINSPDYIQKTFKFDCSNNNRSNSGEAKTCGVCFCDYEDDEWVSLEDCGHGMCMFCFEGYLKSKMDDGRQAILTLCPDTKCNMIVPQRLFEKYLPYELYQKYVRFSCDSFIDLQKDLIWCTGKDCEQFFKIKNSLCSEITCECGVS